MQAVKSIACRNDVTLLEIRAANLMEDTDALIAHCRQAGSEAKVLSCSAGVLYVALDKHPKISAEGFALSGCLEVRVRSGQAIVTLVGQSLDKAAVARKIAEALPGVEAFVIPSEAAACAVRVAVPQQQLQRSMQLLHQAFFGNPDPQLFVAPSKREAKQNAERDFAVSKPSKRPRAFRWSTSVLQAN